MKIDACPRSGRVVFLSSTLATLNDRRLRDAFSWKLYYITAGLTTVLIRNDRQGMIVYESDREISGKKRNSSQS